MRPPVAAAEPGLYYKPGRQRGISVLSGRPSGTMLRLGTFGGLILERDTVLVSRAQPQVLALLARLAGAGRHGVSRDTLLALFWPDAAPDRAAHRLAQLLYATRHAVAPADPLEIGGTVRLNAHEITSDLQCFRTALAARRSDEAAALYTGPFLDGFFLTGVPDFERWVEAERATAAAQCRTALEALIAGATKVGDAAAALRWSRDLVALDPLSAQATVYLMDALAAAGERPEALAAARHHANRVSVELDSAPAPAVSRLAARLRTDSEAEAPVLSLAVLPFDNLSPGGENEYFSDGMTEELLNALSRVPGLRVASRTSTFALKGTVTDAAELGRRLSVDALLEGSVRKAGTRIRVTARLVSAADGYQLWADSYDGQLRDVFALQEAVARAIVTTLRLRLAGADTHLVQPATRDLEAYTLYLRSRYFWNRRTVTDMQAAIEYLNQALERDSNYALAHAGLADCYSMLGFDEYCGMPPHEAMPKADAAARRALELDPRLAEAHGALGVVGMLYHWDWAGAEQSMCRAITLKPNASPANSWHAFLLAVQHRHGEAIASIKRAHALDPLSVLLTVALGRCYAYGRQFEAAAMHCRAALEMDATLGTAYAALSRTYQGMEDYEAACSICETALGRAGRSPLLLKEAAIAHGYARHWETAFGLLAELRERSHQSYVPPSYEVVVLTALGELDAAFARLAALIRERSGYLPFAPLDWSWRRMWRDSRFEVATLALRLSTRPDERDQSAHRDYSTPKGSMHSDPSAGRADGYP